MSTPGNPFADPQNVRQTAPGNPFTESSPTAQTPTVTDQPNPLRETAKKAVGVVSDITQGAGEGVLSTTHGIGELIRSGLNKAHPGLGDAIIPPQGQQALQKIATPDNLTQGVGKFGEQVGEFLLPGPAEGKAIEKAAQYGPNVARAARILVPAVSAGVVNKAQGGSFTGGAAAGAAGGAVGEGLKALAPGAAEGALNVTNNMRGKGRTVGKAILEETKGISPSKVANSATDRIGQLMGEMEGAVHDATAAGKTVSTDGAHAIIDSAEKAAPRNASAYKQKLSSLRDLLDLDGTGRRTITPDEALEMKRGIDKEIGSWDVNARKSVEPTKKLLYRAIDKEIDAAAPGTDKLNQRISSLIQAKKGAGKVANTASVAQKIGGRVAAHTGALAGAGIGSTLGYQKGGAKGALVGGLAGLVAPEVASSPEGRMAIARGLSKGERVVRPLVGAGLQVDRSATPDEK